MTAEKKIVNLDYLNNMSGGDSTIIREMIDLFIAQIPEFLEEMHSLYQQQRWVDLGSLAHKAKSSILIMGMDGLSDKLKELELKTKKDEDIDSYQGYIDLFEAQTSQAIEELQEIIKNL